MKTAIMKSWVLVSTVAIICVAFEETSAKENSVSSIQSVKKLGISLENDLIPAAQHGYHHHQPQHHPTSSKKSHWDKGHGNHG